MKLLKIEMIGFKSFADRIKLEFHGGITGIVGPNGCGKSNIADAFRWVLGEQSAKSLRGGKMLDVIFAGSAHRKPFDFAEVTVTLGEIQGALHIQEEEVAITRRLYRSGESEYFLNHQPVRLRDVQAIFLDSGIGKDAYSIFEQGKIDLIIHYAPIERRTVFEEAAGILRFLQRKREALKRLEQSDLNIVRIQDVHREIAQRMVILQEQAEKARLYKEGKAELERLEKGVLIAKWNLVQTRLSESQRKEEEQRKGITEAQQRLVYHRKESAEVKDLLEILQKKLKLKQEEVFKARSDKEITYKEWQTNQERLKEVAFKEKQWRSELEGMLEKKKGRQQERLQHHRQQSELEAEVSKLESALKAQKEKTILLEQEVAQLGDLHQIVQRESLQLIQSENQLQMEQRQTATKLEHIQERCTEWKRKREALTVSQADISQKVTACEKHLLEISEQNENYKRLFEEKERQVKHFSEMIQTQEETLDKVRRERTHHEARHKVLLRLKQEKEGFSEGTKRLLAESANAKSPLHNKLIGLYECLSPKKGFEAPLAAFMKPYTQTLVVEKKDDYEVVVAFASQHQLKEYSLLCLEDIPRPIPIEKEGCLLEKMESSSLAHHFFKTVFSSRTYKEALEKLKKQPGCDIWLDEGCLIDRYQVVYHQISSSGNNVFMREAEIKELEVKLDLLEKEYTDLEKSLKEIQQRRAYVHAEKVELDKVIRKQEMAFMEHNFSMQRFKGDLERGRKEALQLDADLSAQDVNQLKLTVKLQELQEKQAQAKNQLKEVLSKSEVLGLDHQNKKALLKIEQRNLQEKEALWHRSLDENRKVQHLIHVVEVKDTESQQQEKRLEEEIHQSQQIQKLLAEKNGQIVESIEKAEQTLVQVSEAYAEQEKEGLLLKAKWEKAEGRIQEEAAKLRKSEQESHQVGIQKAHLESMQQGLETEIKERFHLVAADVKALESLIEEPLERIEKKIRVLRQEIEAAGDVNMMSIAEYTKEAERHRLLDQELQDMNLSKQELVEIIGQLDGESRKQFKKTFDQIRDNFKKNFSILFNGGEADLQLTETTDILEAGIEIIAKPPGKQMRSIQLLSGGEKCMTAIALLFAIFEVKPSPFCILDEIDAPLDDSNIERFVNMLKQFIGKSQFIMITHNKRTMAIADVLFGVSMEEKGVSKILSINFIKSEENKRQMPVLATSS